MKNRGYTYQTKGNTYTQPCYCCADHVAQSCKHVRVAAGHLAYVCLRHVELPVADRVVGYNDPWSPNYKMDLPNGGLPPGL